MVDINQVTRILVGLIIVMIIMFIITYLLKRVKAGSYLGNKGITIVSNLFLGNRERLILLEVEGQKALIGVTTHNIQTLLVIDKVERNQGENAPANFSSQFQKILKQQENKK